MNHRRTRSSPCNSPLESPSNSTPNNGARIIRVPIPTFPPTAMVYSINEESSLPIATNGNVQNDSNGCPDYVSAAIMAKVLEERSKERKYRRSMKCYQCRNRRAYIQYIDDETQTNNAALTYDDYHHNSYSTIHRQRSESSSSMESIYNSNSSTVSKTCNETIII